MVFVKVPRIILKVLNFEFITVCTRIQSALDFLIK
jgi:hypothetical protein